eukprot:COSAG02_NODE_20391_length_834_cov_0.629932_2_plen_65_part_00
MACSKAHMGVLGTMAGHLHRSTERKAVVRGARTAQMSIPVRKIAGAVDFVYHSSHVSSLTVAVT